MFRRRTLEFVTDTKRREPPKTGEATQITGKQPPHNTCQP